jgi:hypothetical protein
MSMTTRSLPGETTQALNAFSCALRRESHVLTQHPRLLWQQLYNRLQWKGKEIKNLLSLDTEIVGRIAKPGAGCQSSHRIFRFNLAMVANHPVI